MSKVQTSLIINATNSDGESVSKAVTNVNPDASDYSIKELGKAINDVTDNTFDSVIRVDRTNVTSAVKPVKVAAKLGVANVVYGSMLEGKTGNAVVELVYEGPARSILVSCGQISKYFETSDGSETAKFTLDGKKLIIHKGYADASALSGSNSCSNYIIIKLPENEEYLESNEAEIAFHGFKDAAGNFFDIDDEVVVNIDG